MKQMFKRLGQLKFAINTVSILRLPGTRMTSLFSSDKMSDDCVFKFASDVRVSDKSLQQQPLVKNDQIGVSPVNRNSQ